MDLLQKVEKTIEKFNMLSIGDHVLAGLSGGPDSVCLLHVLKELKIKYKLKISASYIDHGLRPNETPKEIEFCQKICSDLDVPFYTKSVDVREFAKQEKINLQEAARDFKIWRS
jgi:tRNA(Ile)-lysidine synthase